MASTKAVTAIWSGETFTAGSTHADSSVITLDDGYGAALHIKVTNGATGPTVALSLKVQVSADNSEWYDLIGPLQSQLGNAVVTSWGGIEIPIGVEYLKIVPVTNNTNQNVTVDADISEVTALS